MTDGQAKNKRPYHSTGLVESMLEIVKRFARIV